MPTKELRLASSIVAIKRLNERKKNAIVGNKYFFTRFIDSFITFFLNVQSG